MSGTGSDNPDPATEPAADSPDPAQRSEQDWAYVMGKLTELDGGQAELAARLSVTEDRTEDIAVAFDGIENAAENAAAAAPRLAVVPDNTLHYPADHAADHTPDEAPPDGPDRGHEPGHEPGADDGAGGDASGGGIDMAVLLDWVRDHIALLLERKLPQTGNPPHWCRSWWMHAEAIARFEALRRCWADAVTSEEGSAMVVWFEHLDQQLAVLMANGGPFNDCKGGAHRTGSVHALGQQEPGPGYLTAYELLDTGT